MIGPFGQIAQGEPPRARGGDRRRQRHRRGIRHRTRPAAAAGSSAATSTKSPRKRTVDAIADVGGEAVAIRCDVTRFDDVQESGHAVAILVRRRTHAGDQQRRRRRGGAPIGELPLDDWQWVLGINLWGPIHGCHVFAPILRTAEPSHAPRGIINVASAAAFGAAPGMAAYNVSKAGVLSLSETLAAELSGSGVKVTVLCPTFVKTNILESGRISAEHDTSSPTKSCAGPDSQRKRWHEPAWTPTTAATCTACRNSTPRSAGTSNGSLRGTYTRAVGLVSRVASL